MTAMMHIHTYRHIYLAEPEDHNNRIYTFPQCYLHYNTAESLSLYLSPKLTHQESLVMAVAVVEVVVEVVAEVVVAAAVEVVVKIIC